MLKSVLYPSQTYRVLLSLDSVLVRLLMKLFKTNNKNIVKYIALSATFAERAK